MAASASAGTYPPITAPIPASPVNSNSQSKFSSQSETVEEVSAAFTSRIHLVVSDAVMPGMRGSEVVRRLREQRPGLRSLIMSGYADDDIMRRGISASAMPFVQKPFTSRDFTSAVRAALDA